MLVCGAHKNDQGTISALCIWNEMVCEKEEDLIICPGLVKEKGSSIVHQFQFLLKSSKWTNETFSSKWTNKKQSMD